MCSLQWPLRLRGGARRPSVRKTRCKSWQPMTARERVASQRPGVRQPGVFRTGPFHKSGAIGRCNPVEEHASRGAAAGLSRRGRFWRALHASGLGRRARGTSTVRPLEREFCVPTAALNALAHRGKERQRGTPAKTEDGSDQRQPVVLPMQNVYPNSVDRKIRKTENQ